MVLGIVKAHHRGVTVESDPGRGSVFRVYRPVFTPAICAQSQPNTQPANIVGGGTVLVIEDDPAVRRTAVRALESQGLTVLTAQEGIEGVEAFREHRNEIRCVLCDVTMPRLGGCESLTALRALAPDIPVVLASGYGQAQAMAGHHPDLPQAFLSKPYEYQALVKTISQVLAARKTC